MGPLKAKVSPIIMMDFGETREKKNGPQSLDSGFRHKEKKANRNKEKHPGNQYSSFQLTLERNKIFYGEQKSNSGF